MNDLVTWIAHLFFPIIGWEIGKWLGNKTVKLLFKSKEETLGMYFGKNIDSDLSKENLLKIIKFLLKR